MLRPWIPTDLTNDGETEIVWLVADDSENTYSSDKTECYVIKNKGNFGGNAIRTAGRTAASRTDLETLNNRKVLKNLDTNGTAASYHVENTNDFACSVWGWSYFSVWKQAKNVASGSTSSAYHGVTSICMPLDGYEADYGYKNIFEFFEIEYGSAHTSQPGRIRTILNYRKDGHWNSYHQYNYANNSLFSSEPADQQTAKWVLTSCIFNYSIKTLSQIMGDSLNVSAVSGQYTDTWKKTYSTPGRSDIAIQCCGSATTANAVGYYGSGIGLAEAIYMRRPPEPEEIVKIQGYLAHEWGLTAQLPEGHPYKTERPMIDDTNIGTYVRKVCDDITTVFEVAWSGSSNENGIYIIKQKELNLSTLQKPIYHGVQVEGNWVLVIDGLTVDENMSKITTTVRFECQDKTYVVKQKQLTVNLTWS